METGMQYKNGIIIPDDNMEERGIHPRWCKVFAVGPDVTDINVNNWILVDHGRWTRAFDANVGGTIAKYRWVDYKDVLLVQDEKPESIVTN